MSDIAIAHSTIPSGSGGTFWDVPEDIGPVRVLSLQFGTVAVGAPGSCNLSLRVWEDSTRSNVLWVCNVSQTILLGEFTVISVLFNGCTPTNVFVIATNTYYETYGVGEYVFAGGEVIELWEPDPAIAAGLTVSSGRATYMTETIKDDLDRKPKPKPKRIDTGFRCKLVRR